MKLKTASSIMIAATAIRFLFYRIEIHLLPDNAEGFLFINIGGVSIAWFLLIQTLLFEIPLLIFCVSLYRSNRFTRLERMSLLILGVTTFIALLIGLYHSLDLVSYDFLKFNTGSIAINILNIFSTSMTGPFAFFCVCFALSGAWNRGLRILAGILAVLSSLFYVLSILDNLHIQGDNTYQIITLYIVEKNTLFYLLVLLKRLFGLASYICVLIFFVLLASTGYVSHPKMRHVLFSFQGRISRSTYWLRAFPFLFILFIFIEYLGDLGRGSIVTWIIPILLSLFSLWPALAALAKRMHDRGYSGLWLLTWLIPFANAIAAIWISFEVWFLKGTQGPNRFGPDPLQSSIEL